MATQLIECDTIGADPRQKADDRIWSDAKRVLHKRGPAHAWGSPWTTIKRNLASIPCQSFRRREFSYPNI